MGKLMAQPEEVFAAMEKHLAPGEQLRHAVYVLQQSAPLMIVVFLAMLFPAVLITVSLVGVNAGLVGTVVFFIIWVGLLAPIMPLLRKDYMLGLTDQRLAGSASQNAGVRRQSEQSRFSGRLPAARARQAETKIGPMRVFIKLKDAQSSINLQFGGRGLSSNYKEATEIARASWRQS